MALSHAAAGEFTRQPEELLRVPGAQPEGSGPWAEEQHEGLAARLRAWERHGVKFGIVRGMVPGGIGARGEGQSRSARALVSCALDMNDGLTESVGVFRAGGIEVGPEGLPPPAAMRRYAQQAPQGFAFTVMVTDDALLYRFPYGHPDRARRGELNSGFLDPGPLQERMCAALDALDGKLDTVVLRMQPVHRTEELRAPEFVVRLDRFLGGLPRAYRYAMDLRMAAFTVPEYRACLRDHGVAHLLHHAPCSAPSDAPHLRLPPDPPSLIDQLLVPGILSAPFCVARAHGGAPWSRERDDEALTLGVHELIRACGDEGAALTILIESGGEDGGREQGDERAAPALPVLMRLLHSLDAELARRSPLRRRAA